MKYVTGGQKCPGLRFLEVRGWNGRVERRPSDWTDPFVVVEVPSGAGQGDSHWFSFGREVNKNGVLTYGTSLRVTDSILPMLVYLPVDMLNVKIVRR
jgi:hypothetical protein